MDHIDLLFVGAAHRVCSVVESGVEAAKTGVAAEGHDISAATIVFVEVPVLVRPNLSRPTNTDLSFIYNEGNTFISC